MKFEFRAFDQTGNYVEGFIEAPNRDAALTRLQSQNLLVTYLKPAHEKIAITFFQRPTKKDLMLFTRQLAYLTRAKVALDEAIKSLSVSTFSKTFRGILIEIYEKVIAGVPFSQALSDFPEVFDPYYIRMIKVGEVSGNLEEVLLYLADHLEYQQRFRNKVIQAMIYPVIVLILFIAVMLVLFYYVIPQITKIFVENEIPLPGITKFFSFLSNILLNYFFILALAVFGIFYFLWQYFRTEEGKLIGFSLFGKIPIIGPLIKNAYLGQFLESLYYLVRGGVSLVESLEIISQSSDHPLYKKAAHEVGEDVKRGSDLSSGLKRFPELFPSIVVQAVSTGEKSGQLKEMLETMIKYYREDIENRSATLGEALQPVLIIVLGAGLAALELSLLLPLLNLTKAVKAL